MTRSSSQSRYAVFAAPIDTPLWRFGSETIGYDAHSGVDLAMTSGAPFDGWNWRALTSEPRRYGFHGTLKAPFHLVEGRGEGELLAFASAFAAGQASFVVPCGEVALLGAFAALVPAEANPRLDELAADSVRAFDRFRPPLTDADRRRRLAVPLTARQRDHLERWGYPFVFEDFRFHMTLTGPLPPDIRVAVRDALAERYSAIEAPITIDGVAIFRQSDPGEPFRILEFVRFGG